MLVDSFGRVLDYLRVSITDRCNLRCFYCMPPEGVKWKPHENMLSFEEIIRIVMVMADLGVRKIRVTGGEPLLRRGAPAFINSLKAIAGIEKVTLTTNGLLLGKYLDEAAVREPYSLPDGVNISMDALDSERYKIITRNMEANPETIVPLIDRLLEKNITVKINCVPVRSVNEEDILLLANLAKHKNIAVRFIELMALGTASSFQPVPGGEVAALIEKTCGQLTPFTGIDGSGPAVYYSIPGFTGKIGFINPISHGFCETCSRLRLSSEGFLKLCLSSDLGIDLRALLRSGASNGDLAQAIIGAIAKKPQFHSFSGVYGVTEPHSHGMSAIGG